MSAETRKRPGEVIAEALSFFGPGGLGLMRTESGPTSVSFEASGGFVTVEAIPRPESQTGSDVEIVAREWEDAAQKFLESL
jgi:hypothetical protein